jgi:cytoskeletal protein CcmA (bactofilin family)/predicted RNA-binding Zn-ribbon protein involved in translation (DUF1610 family)
VAAKGRIEVQCPHCGNIQLEPELAKSTYCRKCSGYIQIAKGGRTQSHGPPAPTHKEPSLIERVEGLLGVQRTFIARCFECSGRREVGRNATSTICPLCGAYIDLQDYKIVGSYSRSIRTRGSLLITSKGDLNSNRVICESAEIQGHMRGSLICATVLRIRLKGKLSGSVESKQVIIDKKAEVEFVRPIRGELIEIEGTVSARILASGKVIVKKGGFLRGSVNSRSFLVDRGGQFSGEVTIGKPTMVQGELLKPTDTGNSGDRKPDTGHTDTDFSLAPV